MSILYPSPDGQVSNTKVVKVTLSLALSLVLTLWPKYLSVVSALASFISQAGQKELLYMSRHLVDKSYKVCQGTWLIKVTKFVKALG